MADNTTMPTNSTQLWQTIGQMVSHRDDCTQVIFSEMEYLPWDNPDNIVSADVETIVRRVKDNLLMVLFLIGGPANVINMAVFWKQGLRDRVNLCLFALALADELYLISALVFYGEQLRVQFTTKERYGPFVTLLMGTNGSVIVGFGFVSPVLSAIIATERCLCVFNPLKFQSMLKTKTMAVMIAAVYILILSLWFVVVYRYRIGCVYDPTTRAVINTFIQGAFYKAHKDLIDGLDSYVFGVGLSVMEMLVVSITTIMTVLKLRQAVKWRQSETASTISPREVALTKMLVANSLLFIACIFFNNVYRFSWLFLPEINAGRRNHNFFLTGLWVAEMCTYINSTFNFFVYYFMGSGYRETFWALFRRRLS